MSRSLELAYETALRVARMAVWLTPPGEAKVLRSLRRRRGVVGRFMAWGATRRDPSRPLLWMHAPSVGEGLQARPVLEAMRAHHPEVQLAYTYFSPSAERFAHGLDVDFTDYLPLDVAGDVGAALDALRPRALVFSKLDVWPTLTREAHRRGVRLGLVSGTLAPTSGRRSGIASRLTREAFARLDAVGAIDEATAQRLVDAGAHRDAVVVTGDTRYDQVWARAERVDRRAALLAGLASPRPTLIAGSTWPPDEARLLEAWPSVQRQIDARLIIAPHEPTPAHLGAIERWSATHATSLARVDAPGADRADVVLVDRVGVLGDLYALATVAYVGGGFHRAGLHSVLEPAAFGVPVVFGPRHGSSRDAGLLLEAGGGAAAATATELAAVLVRWLGDPATRDRAGARARQVVRAGVGAAARSLSLVERLLA